MVGWLSWFSFIWSKYFDKDIIPYGIQKGIDGDCEEWLVDYLDSRLYDLNISTKIFNE
jgi:hypothetical protein